MATLRSHAIIHAAPEALWKIVSDAANVADWFPAIEASKGDSARRKVTLQGGAQTEEIVVTSDAGMRRFQYAIVGGDLQVERHLGTIDVIEVAPNRSIVVYSTEIEPASLADALGPAVDAAVVNLSAIVGKPESGQA